MTKQFLISHAYWCEHSQAWEQAQANEALHCSDIANLQKNCIQMENGLRLRMSDLTAFSQRIAQNASACFGWYLKKRGHSGRLLFDHDNGTLDMECTMSGQEVSEGKNDPGSLSGGERSFTTLAFVLALSEAMETPFRAMDEFDVYMDSINRKVSMQVLMSIALLQRKRQFLFLTPQDITSVLSVLFSVVSIE
jgi:chromosome segregation ATPase